MLSKLQAILTEAYPDRLGRVYVGPVNGIVSSLYTMLKPILPSRITDKIVFMYNPEQELKDILPSPDDIPDFFGGFAHHSIKSVPEALCFKSSSVAETVNVDLECEVTCEGE